MKINNAINIKTCLIYETNNFLMPIYYRIDIVNWCYYLHVSESMNNYLIHNKVM